MDAKYLRERGAGGVFLLLHDQEEPGSVINGTPLLILGLYFFFFPENWDKSPENTFPQL